MGEDDAETAVFESRPGGRILERAREGTEHTWGTVVEWEPPHRFPHTWHPGRPASARQTVEVRFSPAGEGTPVEPEHQGWDEQGPGAGERYARYDTGWALVLESRFARAAG